MRADIKGFRRRNESVELLERHFEIERLFSAHNFPVDKSLLALHHLALDSAKAKSKIDNLKSKTKNEAYSHFFINALPEADLR
jgi:hypothetical protein